MPSPAPITFDVLIKRLEEIFPSYKLAYSTSIQARKVTILFPNGDSAPLRKGVYNKIVSELSQYGAKLGPGGTSGGKVDVGKFNVITKSSTRQGVSRAGKSNEIFLDAQINNFIDVAGGPIDVVFVSSDRVKYLVKGVNQSKVVGDGQGESREVKKSLRADVQLVSSKRTGVSVKMPNHMWGTLESFWRDKMWNVIQQLTKNREITPEIEESSSEYKVKLDRNIAVECNDAEKEYIMFGSDTDLIVTSIFTEDDFKFSDGLLTVMCDKITLPGSQRFRQETIWFLATNNMKRSWPASSELGGKRVSGIIVQGAPSQRIVSERIFKITKQERSRYGV